MPDDVGVEERSVPDTWWVGYLREDIQDLKGDIRENRQRMDRFREELKGDIQALREELKGDFQTLREELKGDMKELEHRLISQTRWLFGAVGFLAVLITVFKFIG